MDYINQRVAYGNTLVELGKENKNVVVLDADLSGSTMGKIFEQAFPTRHFEMGIAEADMLSASAGHTSRSSICQLLCGFCSGVYGPFVKLSLLANIFGDSWSSETFMTLGWCYPSLKILQLCSLPNMVVVCPTVANETNGLHQGYFKLGACLYG